MPHSNDTMEQHRIGGSKFTFGGMRIERLGAAGGYTLVTIAIDESGSVSSFADDLKKMLVAAVESCKKSPRSDNLLLRIIAFGSQHQNGVREIHGFKLLSEINVADYSDLAPGGMTPLCDAVYSAVGAMNAYGKKLNEDDFDVNAIAIVITDGEENCSVATMKMVEEELQKSVTGETVESMVSVLVGINAEQCRDSLKRFSLEAGMTHFVDAGEATKGKIAKLAGFVSRSFSSQSQALGTGGPSQNISATI